MTAVKTVIGKYADFSGRARRSEYWFWTLAIGLGYIVAIILAAVAKPLGILAIIFYLAIIVPSLAVGVRRLHDTGKSGWFILLGLIPLVGFYLLYLYCQPGTAGANRFGPDPKADDAQVFA